jgi:hypothetical protein
MTDVANPGSVSRRNSRGRQGLIPSPCESYKNVQDHPVGANEPPSKTNPNRRLG